MSDGITGRHQKILVCNATSWQMSWYSDKLIPDGPPVLVDTSPEAGNFPDLWQFHAVIAGTPPYTQTGGTPSPDHFGAKVQYGTLYTTDVATLSSFQVNVGLTIKTSDEFLGCGIDMSESFSYMHDKQTGTEKEYTVSKTNNFPADDQNPLGSDGFAMVTYPQFKNEKYEFQAYDGTPLGYSMNIFTYQGVETSWCSYEITEPGSQESDQPLPGLIPLFNSLDYAKWTNSAALPADKSSFEKMKDAATGENIQVPTLTSCNGSSTSTYITETTVTTQQQKTSLSMDASVGVSAFGCGATASAGAEFSFTGSTKSTLGKDLLLGLNVPQGNANEGEPTELNVYPQYLQILGPTASGKGYLPDGFSGSKPWVITWDVNYKIGDRAYGTRTAAPGTSGGSSSGSSQDAYTTGAAITHDGQTRWTGLQDRILDALTAPDMQPNDALSNIMAEFSVNMDAASFGADNFFFVEDGQMGWKDPDDPSGDIILKADDFDPNGSTYVEISGYRFSTDSGRGSWVRSGETWIFMTDPAVTADNFILSLYFGTQTWSFLAWNAQFGNSFRAADGMVSVVLDINDRRHFAQVPHLVTSRWYAGECYVSQGALNEPFDVDRAVLTDMMLAEQTNGNLLNASEAEDARTFRVDCVEGAFDEAAGTGSFKIWSGQVPELKYFGDVILEVNGSETVIPIDKGADASRAIHLFQEEGMSFFINQNTGFFSLSLWGDRFDPGMIPRDNALRVKMTMGDMLGEVTLEVTGHRDTYQRPAVPEEVVDHPPHR